MSDSPGEFFLDGAVVASGTFSGEWTIRQWADDDSVRFDWIADDGRGGYTESDELYDTIEEAKRSLGVR
jgi:hypothetical protein